MNRSTSKPNQPWYSQGLAFECTQCGGCCSGAPGFVWVDENEIAGLAKFMDMAIDQFERKFVRRAEGKKSLVEYPDGDCIFLDPKTRGCSVYSARPIQCRTWPFWNSNLETEDDWHAAAKECPGCNQGKIYPLKVIESRRLEKDV